MAVSVEREPEWPAGGQGADRRAFPLGRATGGGDGDALRPGRGRHHPRLRAASQRDQGVHRQDASAALAPLLFGTVVDEVLENSGDIDVYVIHGEEEPRQNADPEAVRSAPLVGSLLARRRNRRPRRPGGCRCLRCCTWPKPMWSWSSWRPSPTWPFASGVGQRSWPAWRRCWCSTSSSFRRDTRLPLPTRST